MIHELTHRTESHFARRAACHHHTFASLRDTRQVINVGIEIVPPHLGSNNGDDGFGKHGFLGAGADYSLGPHLVDRTVLHASVLASCKTGLARVSPLRISSRLICCYSCGRARSFEFGPCEIQAPLDLSLRQQFVKPLQNSTRRKRTRKSINC